jgi:hypothetical protein
MRWVAVVVVAVVLVTGLRRFAFSRRQLRQTIIMR